MKPPSAALTLLGQGTGAPDGVIDSWVALLADPTLIAGFAVALLLLVVLLFLRITTVQLHPAPVPVAPPATDGGNSSSDSSDEIPELPPPASTGNHARIRPPGGGFSTTLPVPMSDPITAETNPILTNRPPTREEIREIEKEDPSAGALLWERIGLWRLAAAAHERAGNYPRAADVMLALGDKTKAVPYLEQILSRSPTKEATRLRLVECYLDAGQEVAARTLIEAVSDPASPIRGSAEFYSSVARNYEALNRVDDALKFYREALAIKPGLDEIPQRVLFLRQTIRLAESEGGNAPYPSPATELLDRYIRESATIRRPEDISKPAPLVGHEIIVGHLALGFQQSEATQPVRSVYSLSRRFSIQRQLGESKHSAVFEAVDELLDFPVALKLQRVPDDPEALAVLKERLRAIAKLNHPNLAKIMFSDRDRSVLRVATEYLPGGNLRDFLSRVGGVGVPLLIRMAMHLSSALHSAHLRGVPHGDIRPENILIGHDQRFKLVDFSFSPIPVRRIDYARVAVPESMDTPKLSDFVVNNEGIQSDLLQMGELLEFMLDNTRRSSDVVQPGVNEAQEEMRELVQRLRSGGFTSVLRLWQVLEQIFERTLPNHSNSNPRLSP